jgi:hypothetical protein
MSLFNCLFFLFSNKLLSHNRVLHSARFSLNISYKTGSPGTAHWCLSCAVFTFHLLLFSSLSTLFVVCQGEVERDVTEVLSNQPPAGRRNRRPGIDMAVPNSTASLFVRSLKPFRTRRSVATDPQ